MLKYNNKIERIYSRKKHVAPRISFLSSGGNGKFFKNFNNVKKNKTFRLVCILTIEIFVANAIISAIKPAITIQSVSEAKKIATIISNEQAHIVMEKYKYEDLATIVKDDNGKIQMIKLNIVPVNKIISDVTINIQNKLSSVDSASLSLRMGSFTGVKFLSGIGPKINIRVASVGNINTNLKSEFCEAGINQTLHKIFLEVSLEVVILTPFDTVSECINNQILIAESLLMGEIPNSYYNFKESTGGSEVVRATN